MSLEDCGWICRAVVRGGHNRNQLGRLKAVFRNARIVSLPSVVSDDFRLMLIAVQDDKIERVVGDLSALGNINWKSKVVLHTSGTKSIKMLSPLKKLGAATGGLHPIAAFASGYRPESALGIYYDFFGDGTALSCAREIVRMLKSELLVLKSERQRVILHVASTMASNSTAVAVRAAEHLISRFVRPTYGKAIMACLLESTVRNLAVTDGVESLTGPLVRGDKEVVAEHMKALESEPALLQFYRSWSLLGVELLLRNRSDTRLREIKKLLEAK